MTRIGIRYLTGYSSATLARNQAEWPPHPGRVFMALAAAHFESGPAGERDQHERMALEWLELQGAPHLEASGIAAQREVRAYVPVNDEHGGILQRSRQDRSFLKVRPQQDSVYLLWPAVHAGDETRAALARLCSRVTRIGHSSSLVQLWLVNGEGQPANGLPHSQWMPSATDVDQRLRVASRHTFASLEADFNEEGHARFFSLHEALQHAKGKEAKRLKGELAAQFPMGKPSYRRPQLQSWQGYKRVQPTGQPTEATFAGPFDPQIVILTGDGQTIGLESTLQMTAALRRRAMESHSTMPPEWLSGHQPDGAPSRKPHAAFFPLPFVGGQHGDGHILGLAIAIPRDVLADETGRQEIATWFGPLLYDEAAVADREIEIDRPNVWRWTLRLERNPRPAVALRAETWTRASRVWGSVTPVVLHHYPKKKDGDVERILWEAFVSALGLEPVRLAYRGASFFHGSNSAREFPVFAEGGSAMCRFQTHVVAEFDRPVEGPLLLGRARFRGYGLMRPLNDEEVSQWKSSL